MFPKSPLSRAKPWFPHPSLLLVPFSGARSRIDYRTVSVMNKVLDMKLTMEILTLAEILSMAADKLDK